MTKMQKISPHLWFDNQAEEAAEFYISVFKSGRILRKSYYGKEGFDIHGMAEGTLMTVEFELEGQTFIGLNAGPVFQFNEAISFMINCDTQEEIDLYWEKLSAGGDPSAQQCGWLKDKFGLSWQVTPTVLSEMIQDKDEQKAARAMKAMLQMKKFNIRELEAAYNGDK